MPDGHAPTIDPSHYTPPLSIAGQEIATPTRSDVIDPSSAAAFGTAPIATKADLDNAVSIAARAQKDWATKSWETRADLVRAFSDAVTADAEVLAHLLSREQGKPLAKSKAEVMGAGFFMKGFADLQLDPHIYRDTEAQYVREERRPVGVVGGITAWNYPVLLGAWKIAPAVLTGNAVILKPAPSTPLATLRLAQIADRVFPPGVVTVLTGGDDLGPWMTSHPGIGKISFTGSVATGQAIMANGASTLKRLTLELGGNDAAIVMPDFDVESGAEGLFWSALSNCGQVCAAAKRIFVPDALYDALAASFVRIAASVKIGPWDGEDVEMGPMQNPAQQAKVADLVARAKAEGADVLFQSDVPSATGFYHPLVVFGDSRDDNPAVAEEQFGPIIALSRYSTLEDAVRRANDDPHGLGASVWGTDIDAATDIAMQLEAGSVWINQHPSMGPEIPFGGVKASGMGVECGVKGLEEYTVPFVLNVKKG